VVVLAKRHDAADASRAVACAGGKFTVGVVGGLGFSGGETDAVDDGVGVADGAESVFEWEVAAAVESLADEKDGSAVVRRLVAEEVDGEAKGVEDGGSVVAEADVVDGVGQGAIVDVVLTRAAGCEGFDSVRSRFEVWSEALEERGLAVEGDDGDFVRNVADNGFEHGRERRSNGGKFVELSGASATDFDDDDQSERLAIRILFEAKFLRDAVVGESEVAGVECEDEIAALVADESGNEYQGRASA
jgi:hypothetical protein